MITNLETAAPTGRKKIAQGKKRSAAALGNESSNISSPEGAEEIECWQSMGTTGAELLVHILTERRKRWRSRNKYSEPIAPDATHLPKLPTHWTWATVEQLTSLVGTGATPYRGKAAYWHEGTIPWVTSGALNDAAIDTAKEFITPLAIAETNAKLFPPGTLLVALYGEGKTRGMVSELRIAAATNQACAALQFDDFNSALKPFIRLYLLKNYDDIRLLSSGGVQPNLSLSIVKQTKIPLPPLAEQHRIVAEIEKQFTRLDEGVKALRRVQANLKRHRAAVLKAACEGRLVPTEAELAKTEKRKAKFETGEELLARILTVRRQSWAGRGKYVEPAVPKTTELPQLPEGWTWARFGHLGKDPFNTVQTGPFGAQLHNTEFTESGVPVIAVGNLTGTGFRTDGLYFVNAAKAKQLGRYDVWAGDLLFARSGATLGKVCVAPIEVQDWRMTGHILRARLNQQVINPKIAVYALAALPAVSKQVFGSVRGVTRPGFNTGLLESILIPVPPISEQKRIVAEVERRLSVVEELETAVLANLQRATRLRQSILQKAFKGELV
jgi:type I restriction enzyme S subunit